MKIMYLLYSFTIGGSERLTADICREMVRLGNDVFLYIVNDSYSKSLLSSLPNEVKVKLQKRKVSGGRKFQTIVEITKFICENNIDVIHCNALNTPNLLVLHSFLFRNVKVIHTIHDVGQYKTLKPSEIRYRNKLCTKFIAISESVKKDIIENGADSYKTEVVYNAIDLERFNNINESAGIRRGLVIGNVARFMPEKKGQDLLVEAMIRLKDEFPDLQCVFAGGCDSSHESDLKKLKCVVENAGMEDRIHFVGNVDDVSVFLRKINIFVLPSRYEGFGISLIEAMSMGIPCIASQLDGPAEIIGENERGLLFEPGNVDDLVEKIKFVIANYELLKSKQSDIVKYIHENFDMKIMSNKLLSIYEE